MKGPSLFTLRHALDKRQPQLTKTLRLRKTVTVTDAVLLAGHLLKFEKCIQIASDALKYLFHSGFVGIVFNSS